MSENDQHEIIRAGSAGDQGAHECEPARRVANGPRDRDNAPAAETCAEIVNSRSLCAGEFLAVARSRVRAAVSNYHGDSLKLSDIARSQARAAVTPSSPLQALRALRRCSDRLGRDDPDAAFFAEGLDRFECFSHKGETLDRAFGLSATGKSTWWNELALERRDDAICELGYLGWSARRIFDEIRAARVRKLDAFDARNFTRREQELSSAILACEPIGEDRIAAVIRRKTKRNPPA
jgi:hypothetical protein